MAVLAGGTEFVLRGFKFPREASLSSRTQRTAGLLNNQQKNAILLSSIKL